MIHDVYGHYLLLFEKAEDVKSFAETDQMMRMYFDDWNLFLQSWELCIHEWSRSTTLSFIERQRSLLSKDSSEA